MIVAHPFGKVIEVDVLHLNIKDIIAVFQIDIQSYRMGVQTVIQDLLGIDDFYMIDFDVQYQFQQLFG